MEIGPRAVLSKMVSTSNVWLFRLRFQLVEIKFDFSVSSVTFHGLSSHEELMVFYWAAPGEHFHHQSSTGRSWSRGWGMKGGV